MVLLVDLLSKQQLPQWKVQQDILEQLISVGNSRSSRNDELQSSDG
jgi:hypothetical protein